MVTPVQKRIKAFNSYVQNNSLCYPDKIAAVGKGILFGFSEYSYAAAKNNKAPESKRFPKGSILLPLPQTLDDTTTIGIRNNDLELMGDAIARSSEAAIAELRNSGSSVKDLGNAAMSVMSNIGMHIPSPQMAADLVKSAVFGGDLPQGTSDAFTYLARLGVDKFAPSNIAKAFDAGSGTAFNPKTALIFDSVPLKRVQWSWNFAPASQSESDNLAAITTMFKTHALPGSKTVEGVRKYMLTYPHIVEVQLLGVSQEHFVKYKPMMIEGVSINYAPNELALLAGGRPAQLTLSVSAIETDAWTREDITGEAEAKGSASDLGYKQTSLPHPGQKMD